MIAELHLISLLLKYKCICDKSTTATMQESAFNQVITTLSLMSINPKTSLDTERPDDLITQLEISAIRELLRIKCLRFWFGPLLQPNQGKHHTREASRLLYILAFFCITYIPT